MLLVSDLFEFSWRYQLPALVTLVPAGVLGLSIIIGAVTSRRRGGGTTAAGQATRDADRLRGGPGSRGCGRRAGTDGPGMRTAPRAGTR